MATFKGFISQALPEQSGVSRNGKNWRKRTYVLTYDNSKPEYPKAVVFDVMNDNIDKFNLQAGAEYEVEVDFSVREYQGKFYQSASAWKAIPTQQATQPASAPQPTQQGWQAAYPPAQPQPQSAPQGADDLPF